MTSSFERTRARLQQQVDDGLFTRGAQMTVEIAGEQVLDLAVGETGLGTPMSSAHLFRVYCTIKPVTTLAVAQLVEAGSVLLDEPLETRLPDLRVLAGGVTLRHILTHTAGLHRPMAVEMELRAPATRRAFIARTTRPPGWRLGIDAAYSEYGGWHVLGWLIESLAGEPLREHLRRAVLDPLELQSTWVGMTPDEYREVLPRIGVNVDLRNLGGFPMLFERTERICTETNPAHGGYTNARDLAHFYSALVAPFDSRPAPRVVSSSTLQVFCSPARPITYDQVLARECSYGLGFMTDLRQHAFGPHCGPSSFGHSGNVGASFAFADPARALAVGVIFNGIVGHETAFMRREALVNALYADLDAHPKPEEEMAAARDDPAARPRMRWGRRSRR